MLKAAIIALAEISAINAGIIGMLDINAESVRRGDALTYDEEAFSRSADELRDIANRLIENLVEEEMEDES